MGVRNFYVEASVDGRQTDVGTGPRAKDGGMDVTIYQRNDGRIDTAVRIVCRADGDRLVTAVIMNGERVGLFETERG